MLLAWGHAAHWDWVQDSGLSDLKADLTLDPVIVDNAHPSLFLIQASFLFYIAASATPPSRSLP